MTDQDSKSWVYLDETAYDAPDGTRWRGAGALILPSPMPSESVNIALGELVKDPDSKLPKYQKQDTRTLQRGYFHAADDSQNAHSHWLDQVNANLSGKFIYSIREGDDQSDAKAFREHLRLSLMSSLSRGGRVTAEFEQRDGFKMDAAKDVVREIYAGLDWSQHENLQIRHHYPRVDVKIGDKSSAGLQAVDFILWACLQKLTNPESSKARWKDRLEVRSMADVLDLGEGRKYGELRGVRNSVELALGGRGIYQTDVIRQGLKGEHAITVFDRIVTSVRDAVLRPRSEATVHLHLFAEKALSRLNSETSPSTVVSLARAFLRLFDMAPLYCEPIDDNEFAKLYASKKLAAVMIRDAENGDGMVLKTICELRQEQLETALRSPDVER